MKPAVKKILYASGLLLALCVGVLILNRLFGTICPFKVITGIPCPGCGMTRALAAAMRGQFERAFDFHPLFPLVPVLLAGVGVYSLSTKPSARKAAVVTLFTVAGLFIIVWIYRLAGGWR